MIHAQLIWMGLAHALVERSGMKPLATVSTFLMVRGGLAVVVVDLVQFVTTASVNANVARKTQLARLMTDVKTRIPCAALGTQSVDQMHIVRMANAIASVGSRIQMVT